MYKYARQGGASHSTHERPGDTRAKNLAFTRYCNCQYCVVCIAITGGRGETLYCAIVRAMTGWGGVPKQRVGAQRIVLIRAQTPRNKTMSCIGQRPSDEPESSRRRAHKIADQPRGSRPGQPISPSPTC